VRATPDRSHKQIRVIDLVNLRTMPRCGNVDILRYMLRPCCGLWRAVITLQSCMLAACLTSRTTRISMGRVQLRRTARSRRRSAGRPLVRQRVSLRAPCQGRTRGAATAYRLCGALPISIVATLPLPVRSASRIQWRGQQHRGRQRSVSIRNNPYSRAAAFRVVTIIRTSRSRPVSVLWLLAYQKNRDRRMTQHVLGIATKNQPSQPTASVCPHHDASDGTPRARVSVDRCGR